MSVDNVKLGSSVKCYSCPYHHGPAAVRNSCVNVRATPNVTATFLQDKPDCNIPRALFLSLLLRDRLLPISFNDSKSILNRQLDKLKHVARAN